MELKSLNAAARGDPRPVGLAKLVETVGRPCFPRALFSFAQDVCHAEHLTAFLLDEGGRMRTVIAENAGAVPVARQRADRYETEYWRHDPAEAALSGQREGECWLVKSASDEIQHADYRHECYGSVHLDKRISLSQVRDGRKLRVNVYRRRRQDFRPDEESRIADLAELLMSLVRRHDEETDGASGMSMERTLASRLKVVAPTLSDREREVCALVTLGLTSEGISLRLKIGLNTVLTYRKRAYARLRISSQNELMRLVLS